MAQPRRLNGRNSGGISISFTYFKKGGIVATASTETNGVTIMPTGVMNDISGLRASPVSSLEIR